jgi:hypothetical protein
MHTGDIGSMIGRGLFRHDTQRDGSPRRGHTEIEITQIHSPTALQHDEASLLLSFLIA